MEDCEKFDMQMNFASGAYYLFSGCIACSIELFPKNRLRINNVPDFVAAPLEYLSKDYLQVIDMKPPHLLLKGILQDND